jgi:hypothetical protein
MTQYHVYKRYSNSSTFGGTKLPHGSFFTSYSEARLLQNVILKKNRKADPLLSPSKSLCGVAVWLLSRPPPCQHPSYLQRRYQLHSHVSDLRRRLALYAHLHRRYHCVQFALERQCNMCMRCRSSRPVVVGPFVSTSDGLVQKEQV